MGKINERTFQMMKFYVEHWQDSECKPPAVAKKFRLSTNTVYNHLDEIAAEIGDGITREDLLERIHAEHICGERKYDPVKSVDLTGYENDFAMAATAMENMHNSMKATIEELTDAADLDEEDLR